MPLLLHSYPQLFQTTELYHRPCENSRQNLKLAALLISYNKIFALIQHLYLDKRIYPHTVLGILLGKDLSAGTDLAGKTAFAVRDHQFKAGVGGRKGIGYQL